MSTALLLALAAQAAGAGPEEESLADVLLYARAAQRVEGRPGVSRVEGEATYLGLPASFRLVFDDGTRVRLDVEGRACWRVGFDGAATWEAFHGAGPLELDLALREETLLLLWAWTGQWALPGTPVELSLARADDTEVVLGLRVAGGRVEGELALDGRTYLPRSLDLPGAGPHVAFADYGHEAGLPFARRVGARLDADRQVTFQVRAVAEGAAHPQPFARPGSSGDTSFSFARTEDPLVALRTAPSGELLVRAEVAGGEARWFVLDTGACPSRLTPEEGRRLGLGALGVWGVDVPEGRPSARLHQAGLRIGPLSVRDVVFVEQELEWPLPPVDGVPVAGSLGFDLLARAVLVIDARAGTLALHDPARFELEGAGWRLLELSRHVPSFLCRFEGEREGRFLLDTGEIGRTVRFGAAATSALGLLGGRETVPGADGDLRLGRLAWFELLGVRLEEPTAVFRVVADGPADPDVIGSLGSGALGDLRLVLDVAGRRAAVLP